MDLMLNELSVEGQFSNPIELREAIRKAMAMRSAAKKFGVEVYCHRNVSYITVASGEELRAKLQQVLPRNEKRAVFSWMDKHGPFWEDAQEHDANEWFECDGEIVTDTGLAEAAHCVEIGIDRRMVSFAPSSWERPTIAVIHRDNDRAEESIPLDNYWNVSDLEQALIKADPEPKSWEQFEETCRRRFGSLNFTADSFHPLNGQPLAPGLTPKIISRLNALNDFWAVGGRESDEGRRIYNDHFTGFKGWFSDSTDTEKRNFRRELTFDVDGKSTLCGWHGKLRMAHRQQFRIHFTWDAAPGQLHVVYLGLKITRQ